MSNKKKKCQGQSPAPKEVPVTHRQKVLEFGIDQRGALRTSTTSAKKEERDP